LEFFMLFLAVFLGFIAENAREHIAEHARAKRHAIAMIEDLKTDTAALSRMITSSTSIAHRIDTFLQLLTASSPEKIPSGKLYWYGFWGAARMFQGFFIPDDATLQQMKSSGSISLLPSAIARNVELYDKQCRLIKQISDHKQEIYIEARKLRAMLYDFKYLEIVNQIMTFRHGDQSAIDSFIRSNPPLLSGDKVLFTEYAEFSRSRFVNEDIVVFDSTMSLAKKLLFDLKKEYQP